MNPNGTDRIHLHKSLMASAEFYYDQYVIACPLKGQVALTMKQLRKMGKNKK